MKKISNKDCSETTQMSTQSNNSGHERPTQYSTKLDKKLFDAIFHGYFVERLHANKLAKKYNLCPRQIKYEMYSTSNLYLKCKHQIYLNVLNKVMI
jgi:hypothetical protein